MGRGEEMFCDCSRFGFGHDETQRGLSGSILMECGVFIPAFLSYLKFGTVVNVTL